jgi:hypothetical protein
LPVRRLPDGQHSHAQVHCPFRIHQGDQGCSVREGNRDRHDRCPPTAEERVDESEYILITEPCCGALDQEDGGAKLQWAKSSQAYETIGNVGDEFATLTDYRAQIPEIGLMLQAHYEMEPVGEGSTRLNFNVNWMGANLPADKKQGMMAGQAAKLRTVQEGLRDQSRLAGSPLSLRESEFSPVLTTWLVAALQSVQLLNPDIG